MPVPTLSELELAAKKIVWTARKENNLKRFTPRLVRTTLEEQFFLDEAILDGPEYKSAIKAATKAALAEDPPVQEAAKSPKVEKQSSPVSRKKRKLDKTVEEPKSAVSPKGKGKVKKGEDEDKEEGSKKKRRKTVPKKKNDEEEEEEASSSRSKRQAQTEKTFKSAEHVPSSDMEQDEPDPQPTLKDDKSKESTTSPSKGKINGAASPAKNTTIKESKDKKSLSPNGELPVDDSGVKSESELSVLLDVPPKQKSKSKPKEPKKTRVKKEVPTLSKDEESIKRLKSLIITCGVRKVWSKVFQGLDMPQQQINKLKEILAELGMHGRMSMDQAKAIKRKRELAQELEDVQAFAKAVESKGSGGRSTRKSVNELRKTESSGSEHEKDDDEEEDEDIAPTKRSMNARKSITNFLQNQSSDDECM